MIEKMSRAEDVSKLPDAGKVRKKHIHKQIFIEMSTWLKATEKEKEKIGNKKAQENRQWISTKKNGFNHVDRIMYLCIQGLVATDFMKKQRSREENLCSNQDPPLSQWEYVCFIV